jgi:outer membrane protein TolC
MELKPLIAPEVLFNQQFEIDSLSIQNQKENINNYKPSVLLFADAGYNSTLIGQSYKNFGSVGFNLSIPIYDGNQRQLQTTKKMN